MICSDTNGTMPAVRLEHLDCQTLAKLNDIAGAIKSIKGDGRITLIMNGGNVREFETTTKTLNKKSA